jgi:CBS domain-containing protein
LDEEKTIKDLMVPLEDYARVSEDSTLLEAILALQKARDRQPKGRDPFKAVLVVDRNERIVGKVGQFGLVHALGTVHSNWVDVEELDRMGMSESAVSSIRRFHQYFRENLTDLCRRVFSVQVKEIMHPAAESIDVNASLHEAINKIARWQTLSLLVTAEGDVVGVLRLADVYHEICEAMISLQDTPV